MRRISPIRDAAVLADANDRTTFAERLGKMNPVFTSVTHTDIAGAQLLEILQYAGNGQPLDASVAYDHFTLALGHIAAARGDGARWFCPDPEPGALATTLRTCPTCGRILAEYESEKQL